MRSGLWPDPSAIAQRVKLYFRDLEAGKKVEEYDLTKEIRYVHQREKIDPFSPFRRAHDPLCDCPCIWTCPKYGPRGVTTDGQLRTDVLPRVSTMECMIAISGTILFDFMYNKYLAQHTTANLVL